VAVGHIEGEAVDQFRRAVGLGGAAVTGGADAVETDGIVDFAEQVGGEEDGTVHDRDDGDFLVAVDALELATERFYAAADLRLGHKNALEIRVNGGLFFRGHGDRS